LFPAGPGDLKLHRRINPSAGRARRSRLRAAGAGHDMATPGAAAATATVTGDDKRRQETTETGGRGVYSGRPSHCLSRNGREENGGAPRRMRRPFIVAVVVLRMSRTDGRTRNRHFSSLKPSVPKFNQHIKRRPSELREVLADRAHCLHCRWFGPDSDIRLAHGRSDLHSLQRSSSWDSANHERSAPCRIQRTSKPAPPSSLSCSSRFQQRSLSGPAVDVEPSHRNFALDICLQIPECAPEAAQSQKREWRGEGKVSYQNLADQQESETSSVHCSQTWWQ